MGMKEIEFIRLYSKKNKSKNLKVAKKKVRLIWESIYEAIDTEGSLTLLKPLYRMLHRRSSCVLVKIGWFSRTILQWLSVGTKILLPTAPIYSVRLMTSSSRIGSIGGLVTWANCWRK